MKSSGKSEIGEKRNNNEDSIFISDESDNKNLYIVADGMGGHRAGEVASNSAINAFVDYIKLHSNEFENENEILDIMVGAMQYSNKMVYEKSKEDEKFWGMGTTLTALAIRNKKLFIVHVGDSRVYILDEGKIRQLTTDHSYVMELVKLGEITKEEADLHPGRNIITRAIGTKDDVEVDTVIESLKHGDIVLMCSDGLTSMVSESDIENILNCENTLKEKVEVLINKANENGGKDNISVIILEQEEE